MSDYREFIVECTQSSNGLWWPDPAYVDPSRPNTEEIVRCRDCEYAGVTRPLDWRTGKQSTTIEEWYCQWHMNAEGASEIEPDGFCAWGWRRNA